MAGHQRALTTNRPTGFWTFPVATVSQSESGIELVHQSVAVLPHWLVRGDSEGRWSVTLQLDLNTAAAESRQSEPEFVRIRTDSRSRIRENSDVQPLRTGRPNNAENAKDRELSASVQDLPNPAGGRV
jgi:hypothetical protein